MRQAKDTFCVSAILILVALTLAACGQTGTSPAGPVATPAVSRPSTNAWDELVNAAKKEGTVTIYGSELGAARDAVRAAFKGKYGIDVDAIEGRPAQTLAKLMAERRAGLYLADIGLMGRSSLVYDIKPQGLTVPLKPLLVLPEVIDPSKWRDGKLHYLDKDEHALIMVGMANRFSIHNTDLIKEGDVSSLLDYLEPRWKGKIVLSDPAISGSANNYFTFMATEIFGMERTLEIMRRFAAQEPMMTRDQRLMLEWVARGKYPIGIGHSLAMLAEFKRAGAPVALVRLKEPPYVAAGAGIVFVFDKAPHPSAARLFVNWLLSREGASAWAPAHGYPSLRVDVPTAGFDPAVLLPPGAKFPDEEYFNQQGEMRKVATEIFAKLRQ